MINILPVSIALALSCCLASGLSTPKPANAALPEAITPNFLSYCVGARTVGTPAEMPPVEASAISKVYVAIADLGRPTPIGWEYISKSGARYIQANFVVEDDGSVKHIVRGSVESAAAPLNQDSPSPYFEALLRTWMAFGGDPKNTPLYIRLPIVKPYSELSSATTFSFVACPG